MRARVVARITLGLTALAALSSGLPAAASDAPRPLLDAADAARAELPDPNDRPYLGVVTVNERRGLRVRRVMPDSAAESAGLRVGDLLIRLADTRLRGVEGLHDLLGEARPGAVLPLQLERNRVRLTRAVKIGARRRTIPYFRGSSFKLLVVPVAFADDAGELPARDELGRFFFAETGARGAGASLFDYFDAQSRGKLRVVGEIAPTLRLGKTRREYSELPMGAPPGSLYADAAIAIAVRDSIDVAADLDGIAFLHAGEPETRPSRALWPHRAIVTVGGRQIPYFVHAGRSVTDGVLGEHCHEFTHLLGIADSYGVGHVTGFGDFCLMAIGHRGGGDTGSASPFSLCAHCRVRLGWADVVRVDPRVDQRLRLAAPDAEADTVVMVPLTRRGNEYVLLETRVRSGFDAELPGGGLLVWHVGGTPTPGQGPYGGPVNLIEAHGIDTFDASLVRADEVAFPIERCAEITPSTVPSVRSRRDGAFPFHLTSIDRLEDGSVAFTLGVERVIEQDEPTAYDGDLPEEDGFVHRVDPVTGRTVRFVSTRPDVAADSSADDTGASRARRRK